jgi:hypothetical protein
MHRVRRLLHPTAIYAISRIATGYATHINLQLFIAQFIFSLNAYMAAIKPVSGLSM